MSLSRIDFQAIARTRAKEAGVLAKAGEQQGAYYLAGYAIECALKACIAKKIKKHMFPDKSFANRVYTHDLEVLLQESGLEAQLEADMKLNPGLAANWITVKVWSESSRYSTSALAGIDLHSAVSGPDGVLRWIKKAW